MEKITLQQEQEFKYEIFSSPEDREFLRHIADRFIEKARPNGYDAMLYLEHGARIFSHLIKARWEFLYPGDKVPDAQFIKIGREMAKYSSGKNGRIYDDKDVPVLADKVRKVFNWDNGPYNNIAIVDEFVETGETLSFAQKIMQTAFPQITFDKGALAFVSDDYLLDEPLSVYPDKEEGMKMHRIVHDLLKKRSDDSFSARLHMEDYSANIVTPIKYDEDAYENKTIRDQIHRYTEAVSELIALARSEE